MCPVWELSACHALEDAPGAGGGGAATAAPTMCGVGALPACQALGDAPGGGPGGGARGRGGGGGGAVVQRDARTPPRPSPCPPRAAIPSPAGPAASATEP